MSVYLLAFPHNHKQPCGRRLPQLISTFVKITLILKQNSSSGEQGVLRHGGVWVGRQSLIGQEFKMAHEILPSDWLISSQSVIRQLFKMMDEK